MLLEEGFQALAKALSLCYREYHQALIIYHNERVASLRQIPFNLFMYYNINTDAQCVCIDHML